MPRVFKILSADDLAAAHDTGKFPAAPADLADGYVHLSTEEQVLETARLHFSGRDDLVAAEFDAEDFGPALKWEVSRGGARFPHLYAELPARSARRVRRLERSADGAFAFGEDAS